STSRNPAAALTHLDKPYWKKEGITKGDLVEYYRAVSEFLLPHLHDRPMSLHRFPDGIEGQSFYQKDFRGYKPRFLHTHRLYSESAKRSLDYVVCQNQETLLYLANLGCIEMNPWLSRLPDLGRPDHVVIDLDPDKQTFEQVVEVALEVRKVLDKIGAESFVKTSGATGMHIAVPMAARYDYEEAREFARAVCEVVNQRLPSLTSLERTPAKRGGRLYLDFMQNAEGQTIASPYSVRPHPGAPVSTPLKWSEVTRKLDPKSHTLVNMPKRLNRVGDLWAPLLQRQTDIAACLKKLKPIR
ncbi:MAG TPA: non-homologous end-joining DNA ligase, partial [Bdellovibrionota bacterium]|nr:non-homologous end-joining DNA ligase [Bdellovibrionota bacterium]